MFFIEHNYSQRDVYLVNISIDGGSVTDRDDRVENFSAGKLILRNFSLLYANQKERVFGFHVLNGATYEIEGINWTVYTGEQNISSNSSLTLTSGKELLFFVQYNYSSNGNYTVVANATNGNFSDSRGINITV